MATYTPNYGLHQWEGSDDFLRTEFNQDFSKIDTGLKSAQTTAESAYTKADHAQTAANMAQSTADSKVAIVTGSYTGNGAADRTISLGFQAKAVLLERQNGGRVSNSTYGGLALMGYPCYSRDTEGGLTITSNGFSVASKNYVSLNTEQVVYHYLVFR